MQGSGFRLDLGFRVQDVGFRVEQGCRVPGFEFRVQGLGCGRED